MPDTHPLARWAQACATHAARTDASCTDCDCADATAPAWLVDECDCDCHA